MDIKPAYHGKTAAIYLETQDISADSFMHRNGEKIEVIDPGTQNTNSGPDFFNAKIKIGDTTWIGNVEVHCNSSE